MEIFLSEFEDFGGVEIGADEERGTGHATDGSNGNWSRTDLHANTLIEVTAVWGRAQGEEGFCANDRGWELL